MEILGSHRNRLRIGAPPSVSMRLLPDVLAAIRYQSPTAELSVVDVMSDAGPDLVASGELDVALSAFYGNQPREDGITLHPVLTDPLLVVLPDDHRLAAQPSDAPLDLADLAHDAWVSGPPGRPSRIQLDDAAAERGFIPHVPFQTESYDVAQALNDSGVAISLIPRLALNPLPTTVRRRLKNGLNREIVAVLPTSLDHVPLARDFIRHLDGVARSYEPRH